ncbi:hypothetical protein EC957_006666 [Mortierella hygrophila]|uniref:Uncharacterized protein n=1 Tax=Mortierella hygrophila TaxID=979708 RepID=A0A9P6FDP9_9FUNG|nr:hypothetical protein EC957_006666 [Mortierella hygrophila]
MAAAESASFQDVVKSRDIDGTWKMAQRSFAATAPADTHGHRHISGTLPGQEGCTTQEILTWRVDGKPFIRVTTTSETLFDSFGIWEIQSLAFIAGNNEHALKQEWNPNYFKFRAYKDGTWHLPLDLCIATQMHPPKTSSSVAAFSSLALSKTNGRDVPQLTVMVDSSNLKLCRSRWLQFARYPQQQQQSSNSNSISDDLDADVPDTMDDDFELLDIEDEAEETSQIQDNDNRPSSVPRE